MEYIAISLRTPVPGVRVDSGMSDVSHLERYLLVQMVESYASWKYENWQSGTLYMHATDRGSAKTFHVQMFYMPLQ